MTKYSASGACNFTFDYYRKLLRALRETFQIYQFRDLFTVKDVATLTGCLVRHDVDIDIHRALEVARIENEENVKSTFFIIPDWPLYSLNEAKNLSMLQEIMNLGHEVGLHFNLDEQSRQDTKFTLKEVENNVETECHRLSQLLKEEVRSVSFHRPVQAVMQGELFLSRFVNTYAKDLMRWYLSDSRGRWREGDPMESLFKPRGPLLQLLTHPIWWGTDNLPPEDRLQEFFISATRKMSSEERITFDRDLADAITIRRKDFPNETTVSSTMRM